MFRRLLWPCSPESGHPPSTYQHSPSIEDSCKRRTSSPEPHYRQQEPPARERVSPTIRGAQRIISLKKPTRLLNQRPRQPACVTPCPQNHIVVNENIADRSYNGYCRRYELNVELFPLQDQNAEERSLSSIAGTLVHTRSPAIIIIYTPTGDDIDGALQKRIQVECPRYVYILVDDTHDEADHPR